MNLSPACLLVRAASDAEDATASLPFEASFARFPHALLHLPLTGAAGRAMLSHLGYRIRRAPGDLLSHARRVLLAHGLGDPEASCAAMIDLACALGDKGQALRLTLYTEIAAAQSASQRDLLEALLSRAPQAAECAAWHGTLLHPTNNGAVILRQPPRPAHGD